MKPRILCVDDEPHVLESLRDSLRRRFDIVATTNGFEALRLLSTERFPVVLSDMRMPRIDGARFLTLAREHAPDTVRLLLTGQSTIDDAVSAVNDGQIFRFLVKPCTTPDLIAAIDSGIRQHEMHVAERRVGEQLLEGSVHALLAMALVIDPTAARRADRIARHAVELADAAGVTYAREIGRACELVQLGAIELPPETLHRLATARALNAEQGCELEQLPVAAARFLERMPRLEIERTVIAHLAQPFVPTSPGVAGTPIGARVLRIAIDYDVLELQGVPDHHRLDALRARAGTYDPAVLEQFAEVLGA